MFVVGVVQPPIMNKDDSRTFPAAASSSLVIPTRGISDEGKNVSRNPLSLLLHNLDDLNIIPSTLISIIMKYIGYPRLLLIGWLHNRHRFLAQSPDDG
jgi:hypothetical protein